MTTDLDMRALDLAQSLTPEQAKLVLMTLAPRIDVTGITLADLSAAAESARRFAPGTGVADVRA